MPSRRPSQSGRALALVFVFVFTACASGARDHGVQEAPGATERQSPDQLVGKRCAVQLDAMATAYAAGDYAAHLRYSAGMLKLMSRVEVERMRACEAALAKKIEEVGIAPVLTATVEYSYRLARAPTKERRARHQRLTKVVERSFAEATIGDSTVLLRSIRRDGHRPYSENAGMAVAALSFTELGHSMYARGAQPEHLLRAIEMMRECREGDQTAMERFDALRNNCDVLGQAIQDALPETPHGAGATADGVLGYLAPGVTRGMRDCLMAESSDPTAKMIAELEELMSCMDEQRGGGSPGANISPSATISEVSTSGAPPEYSSGAITSSLSGYEHQSSETYELWSPDKVGMQSKHKYIDPNDPSRTATVTEWSVQHGTSWATSKTNTGTLIVKTDDAGTTMEIYDGNGALTSTHWESSSGSASYSSTVDDVGKLTSETIVDDDGTLTLVNYDPDGTVTTTTVAPGGSTTTTTTAPDGTTTTTTTNPDGTTTTTTTNPDGTTTTTTTKPDGGDGDGGNGGGNGGEGGTTTPVGDYMDFPCMDLPDKSDHEPESSPLDPYINPDPDAPADELADACITTFLAEKPQACPPSVALCVDPVMTDDPCACARGGADVRPEQSAACHMINCGPDATCDPATGTCSAGESGGVSGLPGTTPIVVSPTDFPSVVDPSSGPGSPRDGRPTGRRDP